MVDNAQDVFDVIAATFRCDKASINRATQADDVEGWDSLSHTVLIVALERRFAVRLDPIVVMDVADVGGLVDHVRARCASKTMAGA